jgi:hypothetical protein
MCAFARNMRSGEQARAAAAFAGGLKPPEEKAKTVPRASAGDAVRRSS